jgi:hypothetical protein
MHRLLSCSIRHARQTQAAGPRLTSERVQLARSSWPCICASPGKRTLKQRSKKVPGAPLPAPLVAGGILFATSRAETSGLAVRFPEVDTPARLSKHEKEHPNSPRVAWKDIAAENRAGAGSHRRIERLTSTYLPHYCSRQHFDNDGRTPLYRGPPGVNLDTSVYLRRQMR